MKQKRKKNGGETITIFEAYVTYNQEPNEKTLELSNLINEVEEEREVVLTIDPNTDDEIIYQSTVPAGYVVAIYLPDTSSALYEDEACTVPVESAFDTYADINVYTVTD